MKHDKQYNEKQTKSALMSYRNLFIFLLTLTSFFSLTGEQAQAVQVDHVNVSQVIDKTTVKPGDSFLAGVYYKMDPKWYIYWKNAGDTGLPTQITWENLPDGIIATPVNYPIPQVLEISGLVDYAYKKDVILFSKITVPSDYPKGVLNFTAKTDFLMCKDVCIMGTASLPMTINIGEESIASPQKDLLQSTSSLLPSTEVLQTSINTITEKGVFTFTVQTPEDKGKVSHFIPFVEGFIEDNFLSEVKHLSDNTFELRLKKDTYADEDFEEISGLVVTTENAAYPLTIKMEAAPVAETTAQQAGTMETETLTLGIALIFAFIGGLILNLMPCVLPVLSLKVMGLIHHRQSNRAWVYGMIYTAGILTTFALLASVILSFKSAGEVIGWGFQLQNPIFVGSIIALLILLSLHLFGLFEIGTALGRLQNLVAHKNGMVSTFFAGVLMTIVATPCTAPFMVGAIAYALTQEASTVYLVFSSMALGLAMPYIVLTAFPSLLKWLPKPGAWEITLKQILAFPVLITAWWLYTVLDIQVGSMQATMVLLGAIILAFGCWALGRFAEMNSSFKAKVFGYSVFVLSLLTYTYLLLDASNSTTNDGVTADGQYAEEINWQTWSKEVVDEAVAQGRPVFVDFTAQWCITCKVNKKIALSSAETALLFEQKGVLPLVADWTKKDPVITAELNKYGHKGVPLYLYYPAGKTVPIILPQLLTPARIKEALLDNK